MRLRVMSWRCGEMGSWGVSARGIAVFRSTRMDAWSLRSGCRALEGGSRGGTSGLSTLVVGGRVGWVGGYEGD